MDWKQILSSVDDDYLIGISNKGIVKRAYKDKEESGEAVQVEAIGEVVTVHAGGETVKICSPLGESKCSCPSRSICRHVVLAILSAKEQLGKLERTEETVIEDATVEAQKNQQEQEAIPTQQTGSKLEVLQQMEVEKQAEIQPAAEPAKTSEIPSNAQPQDILWEEMKNYPLKSLMRVLGIKALRSLAERMQRQECPVIEQSSIVTVKLPSQQVVVKLLSPLAHSTCTCHKKDLCKHKAEAILWCQWKEEVVTADVLMSEVEKAPEFDREKLCEATEQIKVYLEELMQMGLCRTGVEVVNTLERLAILAHNAELPRLENNLRALSDAYGRYLRRSASFAVSETLGQVCRLYQQTSELLKAEHNSEISRLAGEFHAEYKPVGNLDLVGITLEHFVSKSGYEGDTVYFLEVNTRKWYTYTNARPTFYEGKKRSAYMAKAAAPWGLSVPIEGMVKIRIHLHGAKSDDTGRLSSSQETQGELISGRELSTELLKGWYYEDFGQAFAEQIAIENTESSMRRECLVFLYATHVEPARFDKINQVLHMPIFDKKGRMVTLEVPYTKKEEANIRYLERMKGGTNACFAGKIYLKGSRLQMYPLEVFTGRQLSWLEKEKEEPEEWYALETTPQDAVLVVLQEAGNLLEDLYQIGFSTVQESVLQRLMEVGETAEHYGMEYLHREFVALKEELSMVRHQLKGFEEAQTNIMIQRYMALWNYVSIGHKKVMYDKAKLYYREDREE